MQDQKIRSRQASRAANDFRVVGHAREPREVARQRWYCHRPGHIVGDRPALRAWSGDWVHKYVACTRLVNRITNDSVVGSMTTLVPVNPAKPMVRLCPWPRSSTHPPPSSGRGRCPGKPCCSCGRSPWPTSRTIPHVPVGTPIEDHLTEDRQVSRG